MCVWVHVCVGVCVSVCVGVCVYLCVCGGVRARIVCCVVMGVHMFDCDGMSCDVCNYMRVICSLLHEYSCATHTHRHINTHMYM